MADFPLLNEASLVMIPGATKEGKVYSQVPTDGSGDFTFTRSTSATRVNEAGNIEKGYENLLTYSNVFSQGYPHWTTSGVNIPTGNQSGYDGSSDAWLLERNATNGFLYAVTSQSGVNTFSVYAKANTASFVALREVNGYGMVYFDLSDGTIGTSTGGNVFAKSIDSVGNGWYRCSIHISGSSLSQVRIHPTTQNGSTSGTTGSIYIQDAQLNQGLVAYPYLETTAAPAYGGITANQPRLDYTDSSCPALLLEPQRFNAIDSSEYAGAWSAIDSNITITNNATTSPEGVDNAVKLEGLTGSGGNQIVNFGTFILNGVNVVGKTYTASVYIKPVNPSDVGDDITLSIQRNTGDFEALTIVNEITSADWKRYDLTYTFTGAGAGDQLGAVLKILRSNTTIDDIYVYGVQLEEGSYATSYIPTYGTSQTRNNDETNVAGLQSKNIITSSQGTMFFDIPYNEGTAVQFNMQSPNDLSYGLRFVVKVNGFTLYQRINNVQTIIRQRNDLSYTQWKIAMAWNGTNLISSINGISYVDTIDASLASQLDTLKRVNSTTIAIKVKQTLVFPTQLTEAELNDLTTL